MNTDIAGKNYFELFSLPPSFEVDTDALERAYRALQSRHHPDRAGAGSDRERRVAVQLSGLINEAYETLCSPLSRAAYLLRLQGVDPEAFEQSALGGEFLFAQMQRREELEQIAERESLDELEVFREQVRRDIEALLAEFQRHYEAGDPDAARPTYNKLQFLYKLSGETDRIEEKILDY